MTSPRPYSPTGRLHALGGLTPRRRTAALLALALGGFAIGTTEFVAMGLLPNIAAALLPGQYAANPETGIAQAGWLVSAYALGVVVGAPTIAAASARFPRKKLLLVLLVGFTLATIASAVLPTFGLVVLARFVAGLPHGAYFGIASIVAADIMGPGNRGKGIAMVMSGLTVANIIGVPAVTFIGQLANWRVAYVVVALLFAATFVSVFALVPPQPADETASIRRELRVFTVPQAWITMGLGAVGFGGFFAVYSYISPIVVQVTHLPETTVPLVLVVVGLGMTLGNVVGGHLVDRSVKRTIYLGLLALIGALLLMVFLASNPVGVFVAAFFVGATSSAIPPAVQIRLMDVAGESRTIAAALNHSAFNIGNSMGAYLGGAAIAAGFGYLAPGWIGIVLAALGVGITGISYGVQRRSDRRHAVLATSTGPITAPVPTA
ncbi:MFS transporter [Curtobacterium sp. Leaf261]|uniref:MFS transporter n=1 Tax=Curtobacterium sp. Leaf261 TaxID=1736311 RepID=UPI0006FED504|nr:MFS transporter [Curtobacterium sp. Leaf261]KQO64645.1 arabinose ABC transporter permease [Curtobacterium sp. Leaf261]